MRIRKNAERVVEGKKSYLICQLNRTPWDDDSFLSQGYWDNDLPLNNSLDDSVPASASVPTSNESMEQSLDYLENSHSPEKGADDGEIGGSGGVIPKLPPPLPPKKASAAASTLPKKRGRPKKPALPGPTNRNSNSNNNNNNNNNNIDSNPYQFYYYSGFGPSWGKRRGETRFNGLAPDPSNCEMLGSSSKSNVSEEEEEEDDVMVIDDDENNKNDNKDDNNCKSSGIVESLDSVLGAERELDFIDDDEEEDEDEDVEDMYVGKRARKPIKARSLKSLM